MGPPSHYFGNPIQQPEYKTAPSGRFHPYGGGLPAYSHGHQQPNPNGLAHAAAAAAITAAASQSSISPTSSSPTHINSMHTTTAPPSMSGTTTTTTATTPIGQPTPSPSPRHCDKCGYVCESLARLNEHMVNAHDAPANVTDPTSGSGNGDIENHIPSFQYANFGQVKSETVAPNDILDLDSQKMVYPPHEANQQNGPLPPMHSLHPMPRPHMSWPHTAATSEPNTFMPIAAPLNATDMKASPFAALKNEFSPQIIKQDHMTQLPNATAPNSAQADISATSPSEFPSSSSQCISQLPNNYIAIK